MSMFDSANGGPSGEPPRPIANIEAEAALLGALMIDNRLIPQVAENLAVEDFHEALYGRVFKALVRFHDQGATANPVTLKPIFENDPQIRELGGVGHLAQLTGSGAALVGALDFAAQITELAARRRLLESIEVTRERLRDDWDARIDDIAGELESGFAAALTRSQRVKPASAADMIDLVLERDDRIRDGQQPGGATCRSISDLNKLFDSFEPKTLLLVAARPGMGKTALALSAAWGFAANGHPTDYYHAEMSREQLAMRLTSDISHGMGSPVPHRAIRRGELGENDRRVLADVKAKAAQLPLRTFPMHDAPIGRLDSAIAKSKIFWERKGRKLEVVIVDYLQLFRAFDARGREIDRDTDRVNAISAGLRRMADRHDICLIALSQLNRTVEQRQDKRPQVSDLRDSGRLEQDADGILLLYREEYYLEQSKPKDGGDPKAVEAWDIDMNAARGKVDLILGKWRHGRQRTLQARFFGQNYAVRGGDYFPEDEEDLLI